MSEREKRRTKIALVLLFFLIGIAIPLVHSTNKVDEWIQKLHHAKEKVSTLHFYFHDTLSGKNPSAVEVAEALWDTFRAAWVWRSGVVVVAAWGLPWSDEKVGWGGGNGVIRDFAKNWILTKGA